jgi:NAD(P)-dependent dehydrogenase (short-subunit alcohol dehydrogenase family)
VIAVAVSGPANGRERAVVAALGAELVHTPSEIPGPPLHGLVVLPAPAPRRPLVELDAALWRRTLDANLTRAMELCRAAGPRIAGSGGGAIVLVVPPVEDGSGVAHLAAASGAVAMLARALAVELGPLGVRVNALVAAPERLERVIPVLRLLLSEEASYVTGEIVPAAGDVLAAS